MKGITELDDIAFLRRLNQIRKLADECVTESQIMEIRKHQPTLTGKETPEEKAEALRKQAKKNINEMLDNCLEKHPEATVRLMDSLLVYDDGETHLKGVEMFSRALKELFNESVIDFLLSVVKLGITG